MVKEWKQVCKDCGREFGYSDISYQSDVEHGQSRPERCPEHRKSHNREISRVGCSHFQLKPRIAPYPILGLPYVGHIGHGRRVLESTERQPETKGMDFGITDEDIRNLYEALQSHQVVVVVGPTGSGKSTLLPFRLIEPLGLPRDFFTQHGPVIITQPRIQATRMIPAIVGERLLGSSVGPGYEVGYRYRQAEEYDGRNRLIYVTDGSLLNWIAEGKTGQYSIIMIDEAHERSCNIDLILALLKRELLKYPHLRLIIASATIDAEGFIRSFKDVTEPKLLEFQGKKSFGYTVEFRSGSPVSEDDLPDFLADKIIDILKTTDDGGILGFLHGQAAIESAVERVGESLEVITRTEGGGILGIFSKKRGSNRNAPIWVFPLYTGLGVRAGKEALKPLDPITLQGKEITPRRVVIATNVAETSLTVPDIVYVVDSGMIKQTEWDIVARTTRLVTRRHSKDGCKQRWGRAGRVRQGFVYTLYTEEEFVDDKVFLPHTSPEITRSCLDDVILTAKASGVSNLERLLWVEKPSDIELQRVNGVLHSREVVDEDGDLTESGFELWQLHRSLDEGSLLVFADRFGCAIEAATALAFLPRLGANLYRDCYPNERLFRWDSRWDASTKSAVAAIHNGLRVGCKDDLAFAIKIAVCYLQANKGNQVGSWARRHFLNEAALKQALDEQNKMIESLLGAQRWQKIRDIDVSLLERLRFIISASWPDRIVGLELNDPIIFRVGLLSDKSETGVISRFSAGDWKSHQKAICAAMTREWAIIEGETREAPCSCFMVAAPKQIPAPEISAIAFALTQLRDKKNNDHEEHMLFVDQQFPVGSQVIIEEKDGVPYFTGIEKIPPPIAETFVNTLDSAISGLTTRFTREVGLAIDLGLGSENEGEEETSNEDNYEETIGDKTLRPVTTSQDRIKVAATIQGVWAGIEKGKHAKITEWISQNGVLVAVLSPVIESNVSSALDKKPGDTIEVKIQRVVTQDPNGKAGWLIARTKKGLDIPIELGEMSLSPLGYGLERIEGQTLELTIKDFDRMNQPQLTNLNKVIQGLKEIRQRASIRSSEQKQSIDRMGFEVKGYIAKVGEDEDRVIVVVPTVSGVVHQFEVNKEYVPMKRLSTLRIGEEVTIRLLSRDGKDEVPADRLTQEEIDKIPKIWSFDRARAKLRVPYCLGDDDFNSWPARPEVIDLVKRHSWQYSFSARIVTTEFYKRAYAILKANTRITGQVAEITKHQDGSPSGVNIQVKVETPQGTSSILGFLPLAELSWHRIDSPSKVVNMDETITVRILDVDADALPPRLVLSRKKAFIAHATIPDSKVGILIGRSGSRVKTIIGSNDASVDTRTMSGNVIVQAASQSIRDSICDSISSQVQGIGKWSKR